MAVNNLTELNVALGITSGPGPNDRENAWLWMFLKRNGGPLNPDLYGSSAEEARMANFLNAEPHVRDQAMEMMTSHLLPDHTLSWITKEDRQLKWLHFELSQQYGSTLVEPPPQLSGRQRLIASIDNWEISPTDKQQTLALIEARWKALRRLEHDVFAWFNEKDQATRCAVAWEWLCTHRLYSTFAKAPFGNYADLISFFDQTKWSDEDKTLCVIKIRRRWSQRTYREKLQHKKQYNFVLSDDANQKLNQLAAKHNLKRNQILEILVQAESSQGIYIPHHLKPDISTL